MSALAPPSFPGGGACAVRCCAGNDLVQLCADRCGSKSQNIHKRRPGKAWSHRRIVFTILKTNIQDIEI